MRLSLAGFRPDILSNRVGYLRSRVWDNNMSARGVENGTERRLINGPLSSKILLWATGAQSYRGILESHKPCRTHLSYPMWRAWEFEYLSCIFHLVFGRGLLPGEYFPQQFGTAFQPGKSTMPLECSRWCRLRAYGQGTRSVNYIFTSSQTKSQCPKNCALVFPLHLLCFHSSPLNTLQS